MNKFKDFPFTGSGSVLNVGKLMNVFSELCLFFSMAQQPLVGQILLIIEVS
jgi:hypothetical protein